MSAVGTINNLGKAVESLAVKPPAHPTYDLKGVIQLALSEDAGDRGIEPQPLLNTHMSVSVYVIVCIMLVYV